jgi:hypothetical protein
MRNQACVAFLLAAAAISQGADTRASRRSWAADNGNGTYSNPLFYDQFSDPDMLALLNSPYAWIGLLRDDSGIAIAQYEHITGKTVREPAASANVWLRVHSNFDTEISQFQLQLQREGVRTSRTQICDGLSTQDFSGGSIRVVLLQHGRGARRPGRLQFLRRG